MRKRSARLLLSGYPVAAAKLLQSCPTLCDPIDGSPPGFPVPGILQARTLEWVAISFSNAWKWKVKAKSFSCVRLCNPMDCSLPGSSIHGIFQARVLEWGAVAFSGGIYTQWNISHKKECIWVSSNEVDEPRTYYTEWSKKEKDKYCILMPIYGT